MFNKSTLFQKPGSEAPTPQNARGQRPLSPSTSPSGDPSANSRDPVGAFSTSSSSQTGNTSANSAARESKTPIEAGERFTCDPGGQLDAVLASVAIGAPGLVHQVGRIAHDEIEVALERLEHVALVMAIAVTAGLAALAVA